MKLWLDDLRPAPPGWVWVKTYGDAIDALNTGQVQELSLDHDLGLEHYKGDFSNEKTGYDVISWMEDQILRDFWRWPIPRIQLHSRNPVGWRRMDVVRERIRKHGQGTQVGMDTDSPTKGI